MAIARRNYKDSLFCDLFGSEERRGYALELYNALAGTSHRDPGEIELTTVGDTVFLGRKNDVSFLVGDELVLMEHQSTHNPNMPLRGLLYFSKLYNKLIDRRGLDIYGTVPLELPVPRYFVLYFGPADRPDREVMRLSDALPAGAGASDLEVTATVLNCNEGRNRAIMQACEALRGYAHLLALARADYTAGRDLDEAVRAAVDRCIDEGVLADYLSGHRAEAIEMLWTIEDEERAMRVHWENVERQARERGYNDGRAAGFSDGFSDGRAAGFSDGRAAGFSDGRAAGFSDGRAAGFSDGFSDGVASGRDKMRTEMIEKLRQLGVDDELIRKAADPASVK